MHLPSPIAYAQMRVGPPDGRASGASRTETAPTTGTNRFLSPRTGVGTGTNWIPNHGLRIRQASDGMGMSDTANNSQGPQDPRIPRPPQDARKPGTPSRTPDPASGPDQPTLITSPVRPAAGAPGPVAGSTPSAPGQPSGNAYPGQPPSRNVAPHPVPPRTAPAQPPLQGAPQPPYPQQPFSAFQQPQPFATHYPSAQPDWNAMAAQQETARKKRKRILLIAGGVVAVLVVVGGAAFGLGAFKSSPSTVPVAAGSSTPAGTPSAHASAATPSAAAPTTAPAEPTTAPPTKPVALPTYAAQNVLSAASLKINGKTYSRTGTATTAPCWKATGGGLGSVLTDQGCVQVLRATYVSGNSAVTVGIAVFHDKADAATASAHYVGDVAPLYGGKVVPFCVKAACAVSHDQHGRYNYFTVAGPTDGTAGDHDNTAIAAGHGFAGYALSQLMKLG